MVIKDGGAFMTFGEFERLPCSQQRGVDTRWRHEAPYGWRLRWNLNDEGTKYVCLPIYIVGPFDLGEAA